MVAEGHPARDAKRRWHRPASCRPWGIGSAARWWARAVGLTWLCGLGSWTGVLVFGSRRPCCIWVAARTARSAARSRGPRRRSRRL